MLQKKWLAVFPALASSLSVAAEPVAVQGDRLKPVIVSASRIEQPVEDVNASVQVITAEEIARFSGRSISEVLQHATGLFVKDSGSSSSVSIRGFDTSHTLLLVDGLKRTEKYAGYNQNNIQLEDIERIEIVRGPMSALYGSEALGGVVNIITRKPGSGNDYGIRVTAGITEGSQRDTLIVGGHANLGKGDVKHRLSFESKRRDDFRINPNSVATDLNNEERLFFSYRGDYRLNASDSVGWNAEYANQDDSGTGLTATNSAYRRIEQDERVFLSGRYDGAIGNGLLSLKAGFGSSRADVNRGTAANETTKFDQTQLDGQYVFQPLAGHTMNVGYIHQQDDVDLSTNSRAVVRKVHGLFLQDQWRFASDMELTLGARGDHYSDFGSTLNPKVSLAWRPGAWTVRGGFGTAFKAPSLLNLYMTDMVRGSYLIRGNPDLQAEESRTAELAVGYQQGRIRSEIVVHRSDVDNLIASVRAGRIGSQTLTLYRNVNKAEIQGAEFTLAAELSENWHANLSVENSDAVDGNSGSRLADRAAWHTRAGISGKIGKLDVSARIRNIRDYWAANPAPIGSPSYNSAWTSADIRLGWSFSRNSSVFAGIDNLADKKMPDNMMMRGTPEDPGARYYYMGYKGKF